jgi:protein-L-isoaspartate(D-aspartate) O-methyltransferase
VGIAIGSWVQRGTTSTFSSGQSITLLTISPTFDGKRTIPSEQVRAIVLDLLHLGPSDKVLEIGTGSGTMTSDFGKTGAEVHSIELEPWVDSTVITGDYVFLHSGDGVKGLPQFAPFTAIVATCGIEGIPKAWADQLAPNGRLIAPIGDSKSQRLVLFRKIEGDLLPMRVAAYCRFSMMREKPSPKPPKYQPSEAQP